MFESTKNEDVGSIHLFLTTKLETSTFRGHGNFEAVNESEVPLKVLELLTVLHSQRALWFGRACKHAPTKCVKYIQYHIQ